MNAFHYDDDKAIYISRKYRMYERHWKDVLELECTDNWEMYNGFDRWIHRRKAENRSSLQRPTLFPAIEGRVSQIMERLKSREPILPYEPVDRNDPDAILSALKIQQFIRDILDRQNWLEEIAVTIVAAEIFPIVWLKCRLDEMVMSPAEQRDLAQIIGVPPSALSGKKRTVPSFELLSPGNVYYDYRVKNIKGDIEKFQVKEVPLEEIGSMFGSDIVRKIEHQQTYEPQWVKDWEMAAGRRSYRDEGEPRFRLAEGWIQAHYADGHFEKRVVRFLPDVVTDAGDNNVIGLLLDDDPAPVEFDPFIPVVARRLPFHLLGKSTVALGKAFQREAAEMTNMGLDILGYTAAPPIVMEKGAVDNPDQLEFSARSMWLINDGMKPPQALHVPIPNAPFMQVMQQQMDSDLNHVTAAYEGITGQQSGTKGKETLGAFRSRTNVGRGRLDLPLLSYATMISRIGECYLAYIRAFPRTILAQTPVGVQTPLGRQSLRLTDLDVNAHFRVQNLTEFENNEMKKIELDRAIERTLAYPITQMNIPFMKWLLEIYWKRHITDPHDFEGFQRALNAELDPNLLQQGNQGGAGVNNLGMPLTNFSPGTGSVERNAGMISAATAGGG